MAQTDINMTPHKIGMWLLLNMILILHRLDLWHLMIRQVSSDNYYRFQDVAFCGSLIGLLLSTQIKTTWRKDNFWKNHVALWTNFPPAVMIVCKRILPKCYAQIFSNVFVIFVIRVELMFLPPKKTMHRIENHRDPEAFFQWDFCEISRCDPCQPGRWYPFSLCQCLWEFGLSMGQGSSVLVRWAGDHQM